MCADLLRELVDEEELVNSEAYVLVALICGGLEIYEVLEIDEA